MSLVSIKWCAFRTSPVTWHRDFVYIDCIEPNFSDSRGTRCAGMYVHMCEYMCAHLSACLSWMCARVCVAHRAFVPNSIRVLA